MKLYAYYRSSTSYRLRIALALKGLDYELIPVSLLKGEHREADFLAKNPFGGVPLLEADGRGRAQSVAIMEWLDDAYPDRPLLPADPEARFTSRELTHAIATDIHALLNLQALRYLRGPLGHSQEESDEWYSHWLGRTLVPVEARLAELGTGDFLFDAPGMFEAVLIPQIYNARRADFDLALMPHIRRIEAACLALPAFIAAHPDNQPDNPERNPT